MKLLRYGPAGQEKPGMLDADGRIRSLHPAIADITCDILTPQGLAVLRAIDPARLPLVDGAPRLGPPVANPRQFIAIGRNYALHVQEAKNPMPDEPMIFNKALSSISGSTDDIPLYPGSVALDYEGELAVVMSRPAHRIKEEDALDHVAGYCICNDVSERDWQFKRGGLIGKGKSAPGYGPLGPYLVTTDEIPDPQKLRLRTWVNGDIRQDASTASMLFPVAKFIAHLSEFMALLPGDVLPTGTPEGVAGGMENPKWLKAGDRVEIEITGLGRMSQTVRAVER
jgi:2-keto-4-pentenoate hydratase/2-oxohepta-3-ene-1,7-dioic acid hydratase in catechol pathway